MTVHRARGEDLPVAGEDLRARPDDQTGMDPVHGVGVAGLAERDDPAVPDADVGLDHAPVIQHDRAGDDQIGGTFGTRGPGLSHGLPDHLAAAEHRLVAGAGVGRTAAAVLGHLDEQAGVRQADAVTDGGTVQVGVTGAVQIPVH